MSRSVRRFLLSRPEPRRDEASRPPGIQLVHLAGDIDLANAASRADLLCGILELGEASVLVVDCSDLHVLGSQGSAMMLQVHRHATALGTRVVWANLSPLHRLVLDLTDVSHELHLRSRNDGSSAVSPPEIPHR